MNKINPIPKIGDIKSNVVRQKYLLLIFVLIFFFIYSYFSFLPFHKYSSPDETLNYFFTNHFIENGNFKYEESLNSRFEGIIKPRSFAYAGDGYTVPGSFLGLPLFYGVLGKIFGTWIIYYIGPLLASLSVFFFYLFIKKIFTDKIAFISSLILFTQPIFIFYAMRPFWHNGLFVSFLIIASYFLLRIINEKKWRDYLLFGIFLGLSLAIRTSELVWILFSVIAFLGINYKKINRKYLIISLFSFIIILAPLFYYQYQTYGNALTTSYTRGLFEGTSASNDGNSSAFQILSKIFLPFGYKPELFLKTFYNYSFKLMFPWFTLAIFGLVIILKRFWQTRDNKKILFYSLWFLGVSLWLMVFYGSLKFVEYINEESILIGISYARYWLPIYIFCLPLTVVFTLYISEKIIPEVRKLSLVLLVALIIFVGIFQIFLDPYYGVQETKTNFLAEAKTKLYFALEKTEKNAIIIAGVSDKIYWPERRVIGYNGTIMPTDILVKIKSLSEISPVYYDCSTSSEIQRVNNYLYERELNFKPVAADSNFYVLSKIKNDNL